MASYVRIMDKNRFHGGAGGVRHTLNPYERASSDDLIENNEQAWTIWFAIADDLDHEVLKRRVPASFHDLIDGREACPDCGAVLGYRPGPTKYQMDEVCPACGHRWMILDPEEDERSRRWADWQHSHGQPRSLSEFWAMKAREAKAEKAES